LKTALNNLYQLIPNDIILRSHRLGRIVKKANNNYSILFSLQETISVPKSSIKTSINHNVLTNEAIKGILYKILIATSPKEINKFVNMLETSHQIVLKHLLTNSTIYSSEVIIHNIPKLYTLTALKEELYVDESTIKYVIHSSPELDFTFRSGVKTFSSIKDSSKRPNVPPTLCYITDGNRLVMVGDKTLYYYFNGIASTFYSPTTLKTVNSEKELKEIKKNNKGKYITLLGTEKVTEYVPASRLIVEPFDWVTDKNYNAIGFVFKYEGNVYKVKHKITKKLLEQAFGEIKLAISYTKKASRLTHINIEEVIIGEQ